jgi:hypothetical protein
VISPAFAMVNGEKSKGAGSSKKDSDQTSENLVDGGEAIGKRQ